MIPAPPAGFVVRTDLRPGDIGMLVHRHGVLYSRERNFDVTFEAYVAGPLAKFALERSSGDRLWIAEKDGDFAGCIAIVRSVGSEAQLRWFLVDPSARGSGLGQWLLQEAVAFARSAGYESVMLWTVSALESAARLYRAAGFRKVEEKPGKWGVDVVEERYVLDLRASRA